MLLIFKEEVAVDLKVNLKKLSGPMLLGRPDGSPGSIWDLRCTLLRNIATSS